MNLMVKIFLLLILSLVIKSPSYAEEYCNLYDETSDYSPINSVAYADGRFIAVGTGKAYISNDGYSWQSQELDWSLEDITSGPDGFFAVGLGGIIVKTQDGYKWEVVRAGGRKALAEGLNSIVWGDGKYVAVGNKDILLSEDGQQWDVVYSSRHDNSGLLSIFTIAYNNATFITGAYTSLISNDGKNWKENDMGCMARDIIWDGRQFIGVSDNKIYMSHDGQSCHINQITSKSLGLKSIAYNNSIYVAVGECGIAISSKDAKNWRIVNSNTGVTLDKIIWNGQHFIAVGGTRKVLINKLESNISNNKFEETIKGDNLGTVGIIVISDTGLDWERTN